MRHRPTLGLRAVRRPHLHVRAVLRGTARHVQDQAVLQRARHDIRAVRQIRRVGLRQRVQLLVRILRRGNSIRLSENRYLKHSLDRNRTLRFILHDRPIMNSQPYVTPFSTGIETIRNKANPFVITYIQNILIILIILTNFYRILIQCVSITLLPCAKINF